MNSEDEILRLLQQERYMEAVSGWRELAKDKGYFGENINLNIGLSARLLEARLLYLSMFRLDKKIEDIVDRFRLWLLDQTAHIYTGTTISLERLALPDSMRVGHPEIDRDHENLFIRANDIRDSLRNDDRSRAAQLADGLIDEILAHFDREEKVLFQSGYPEAATHKDYHSILRSKAEQVRRLLLSMLIEAQPAVTTFDMLISFLVNDPIAADMDLKIFFMRKANGQTALPVTERRETPLIET
jgi:hemerythrin